MGLAKRFGPAKPLKAAKSRSKTAVLGTKSAAALAFIAAAASELIAKSGFTRAYALEAIAKAAKAGGWVVKTADNIGICAARANAAVGAMVKITTEVC